MPIYDTQGMRMWSPKSTLKNNEHTFVQIADQPI